MYFTFRPEKKGEGRRLFTDCSIADGAEKREKEAQAARKSRQSSRSGKKKKILGEMQASLQIPKRGERFLALSKIAREKPRRKGRALLMSVALKEKGKKKVHRIFFKNRADCVEMGVNSAASKKYSEGKEGLSPANVGSRRKKKSACLFGSKP